MLSKILGLYKQLTTLEMRNNFNNVQTPEYQEIYNP